MRVTLEVRDGPSAGRRVVLTPGQAVKVGRLDKADLVLAEDAMLSNVHFVLECTADASRLRDLESRFGTLVNQLRAGDVLLRDGDQIQAGRTSFRVRIEPEAPVHAEAEPPEGARAPPAASPPPRPATLVNLDLEGPPAPARPKPAHRPTPVDFDPDDEPGPRAEAPAGPPLSPVQVRALDTLKGQAEPLFALLDAARDDLAYARLLHSGEEYQTLYEGPKGEALAEVGPFLVRLPKNAPFLETLVREGWGKSWGVYLTCPLPFKETRRHFRRFLLVKTPEGREVYFRFYDPRVLRVFLPHCTPQQTAEFYGPVTGFLLEDAAPEILLAFQAGAQGVRRQTVPLFA
jgi:pSer/pThr/pTyr-binding forkhead associated (FHA) protein